MYVKRDSMGDVLSSISSDAGALLTAYNVNQQAIGAQGAQAALFQAQMAAQQSSTMPIILGGLALLGVLVFTMKRKPKQHP